MWKWFGLLVVGAGALAAFGGIAAVSEWIRVMLDWNWPEVTSGWRSGPLPGMVPAAVILFPLLVSLILVLARYITLEAADRPSGNTVMGPVQWDSKESWVSTLTITTTIVTGFLAFGSF